MSSQVQGYLGRLKSRAADRGLQVVGRREPRWQWQWSRRRDAEEQPVLDSVPLWRVAEYLDGER